MRPWSLLTIATLKRMYSAPLSCTQQIMHVKRPCVKINEMNYFLCNT